MVGQTGHSICVETFAEAHENIGANTFFCWRVLALWFCGIKKPLIFMHIPWDINDVSIRFGFAYEIAKNQTFLKDFL